MLVIRPDAAHRVDKRIAPSTPRPIRKFTGNNIVPSVLESKKNTTDSLDCLIERHTRN